MKRVILGLIFVIVALYSFVFTIPKEYAYYYAEKLLDRYGIILAGEKVFDGIVLLKIQDAAIFVKKIKIAHIQDAKVFPLLFFNTLTIDRIRFDKENLKPLNLTHVRCSYTPLFPFTVHVEGKGDFFSFFGKIDLKAKEGSITLQMPAELAAKLQLFIHLKSLGKGTYYYEFSY